VEREALDVLDAIHSTPARRYLRPDPIPVEIVRSILDAAIRGPTGGNGQAWGWVVVTEPDLKRTIADWYREGWNASYGARKEQILAPDSKDPLGRRGFLAAEHLAMHL
jgi:nitroreductase